MTDATRTHICNTPRSVLILYRQKRGQTFFRITETAALGYFSFCVPCSREGSNTMGFGKTERKKERNTRKNKRKKEREEEKKIINPKWRSVKGTRVFLNDIWMFLLNLLQLYIRHKTAKPQISDVAANPTICLALKDPASILCTVCFGRGFQYHFLDFVAVQES